MRLTTLLDTDRVGSGPWPSTDAPTETRPTISTPQPSATRSTVDDRRQFNRLVADLIPCRNNDSELWFAERTVEVERAKALCRECPLIEGCLAGALEREEPWGVWGGQVFVAGAVVATKRGRGRPRKDRTAAA
ncbi:WhiB family transcriptional regulator [Cellulomonas soli]|uniref:Transcriptional regulator WhiB n=1 Tax=Cellulomonas soli TaxID=931535 RepID=A0A512P8M3_9CELL|nr:WhiB family transcriptional regulator [Cellulomonas soli]NYI57763.1 WhiB family redox-sensing transcriptional regulator [Cellulomonas soli]GEP67547.1 transcriptional regulator WhiB [Cellulomonas soli]